jgi:hypothetical protein
LSIQKASQQHQKEKRETEKVEIDEGQVEIKKEKTLI